MRLAILLASEQCGNAFRSAASIARLHADRDWQGLGGAEVVLGVPEGIQRDLRDLRAWGRPLGISVREFAWREVNAAAMREMVDPSLVPPGDEPALLPDDAGREFRDADAWIFVASYSHARVPWLRPTAVFCPDLMPRRAGAGDRSALAGAMMGWRRAVCAFAPTPTTHEDLVSYAGVHPERALLAPLPIAPPREVPAIGLPPLGTEPGIVWATDRGAHQDHAGAVAALRLYFARGGTLPVTICGPDMLPREKSALSGDALRTALAEAPELHDRISFAGQPPAEVLQRLVVTHGIVWHHVLAETFDLLPCDAARAGAHVVASSSPPLRWLCERHGVAPQFYPPREPEAAAAALLEAEQRLRAGNAPLHPLRDDEAEPDMIAAQREILARLRTHVVAAR